MSDIVCIVFCFTFNLMLWMLQTGDKSAEVTARMNLSDLRLVVGLKSKSNLHPNIFHNTNTNSSALPLSYHESLIAQRESSLQGKFALFRKVIVRTFWSINFEAIYQLHLWICGIAFLAARLPVKLSLCSISTINLEM